MTSPPPYSPPGDDALEVEVLERVILDVHGHALRIGIERRPFGTAQLSKHAAGLEPQVVVQARGAVALHDEAVPVAVRERRNRRAPR